MVSRYTPTSQKFILKKHELTLPDGDEVQVPKCRVLEAAKGTIGGIESLEGNQELLNAALIIAAAKGNNIVVEALLKAGATYEIDPGTKDYNYTFERLILQDPKSVGSELHWIFGGATFSDLMGPSQPHKVNDSDEETLDSKLYAKQLEQ